MALYVIVTGIALAASLAAWSTLDLMFGEDRRVAKRLRALDEMGRWEAGQVEPLVRPFRQRVIRPAGTILVRFVERLTPSTLVVRLDKRARAAGHPFGIDGEAMIAIKIVAAVTVGLAGLGISYLILGQWIRAALAAVILASIAWFVPDVWLDSRVSRRKDAIRRELPDMLDMLMIAVEAGLGFDAAVTKYVQKRSGPLSEEMAVMLRETQAGVSRRDALRHMADRCDVFEFSTFAMAMIQADAFGVSVGNVLRSQSREMRVKRRQYAEEVAQKAPAKMVFPLILCILPATLIVLAVPALVGIITAFARMG